MYKSSDNTLFFLYVPPTKNLKLTDALRQYDIKYIAIHPRVVVPVLSGIKIIDGSDIQKHLLLQAFFSYVKERPVDIEKTGIHICADNISDICFLFDKISKYNTVYSMNTENERFYPDILKKYGISIYFTNDVSNKIILRLGGKIPENKGSHIIDISNNNHKLTCGSLPDIFTDFSYTEAELLIRMIYDSVDDGFYDSGIRIAYV